MLRFLAAAVGCLLFVAPALAASGDFARFHREAIAPSVYIGGCTGTVVYSGEGGTYVLTARHCIKGAERNEVGVIVQRFDRSLRKVRDEVYYAKVDFASWNSDLAMLRLFDADARLDNIGIVAPLDAALILGEPVWTTGYPMAPTMVIGEGSLGPKERLNFALADQVPTKEWQRAAVNLAGGNSGGALWHRNDRGAYQIVGVATAGIRGSLISVFVSIEYIHDFLKRLPPDAYRSIRCRGFSAAGRACPS